MSSAGIKKRDFAIDADSSDDEADIKRCRRVETDRARPQDRDDVKNGTGSQASECEARTEISGIGEEEIEISDDMYAFCCSNCTCSDEDVARYFYVKFSCSNSGNSQMYHRGCCHKIQVANSDSLSPMKMAIENVLVNGRRDEKISKAKPLTHLAKKYNQGKRDEAKFYNDRYDTAKDFEIYSSKEYNSCVQEFRKRVKNEPKLKTLRVLDLFCGIGSGTLVLKKIGIPLHTVVHVEHDPVAMYVNRYHHEKSNDGIKHVYRNKYEDICGDRDIDNLIDKYGPFDLLLAAAPCQNYSKVNGFREQNRLEQKLDYLSDVGRLITKIDEIQMKKSREQYPILFVSENVTFEKELVEDVSKCYEGLPPLRLDARDFGPCKRDRLYWTNIPVNNAESITHKASMEPACKLIESGYVMTETVLQGNGDSIVPKANTFMASKVRIDDARMIKVKRGVDNNYYIDTYSVSERERMLGFPINYVGEAVNKLFGDLTQNAFLKPETEEGAEWRKTLSEDLHHFHASCDFKVKPHAKEPFFHLEISTPKEAKQVTFYNEDQYCKHLLGNGWSIPVVEYILGGIADEGNGTLGGLKDLCEGTTYDGYDYNYPWAPYNALGKVQEYESADV